MKHKVELAKALTADFAEGTQTFEMQNDDFKVKAGEFAIVPLEDYKEILTALRRCAMSMQVHPDNQENSEFNDFSQGAWEVLDKVVEF